MAHRFGEQPPRRGIPNSSRSGFGAGGKGPAVGTETGPKDGAFMTERRERWFSRGGIPESSGVIRRGRQQQPVIRAERGQPADTAVVQRSKQQLSLRHRP